MAQSKDTVHYRLADVHTGAKKDEGFFTLKRVTKPYLTMLSTKATSYIFENLTQGSDTLTMMTLPNKQIPTNFKGQVSVTLVV